MNNNNPFADFGTPVVGKRFFGREEEIQLIQSRIFQESGYGSLSIYGLPRIGKTSLILEAINHASSIIIKQNFIVFRIDIGAFISVHTLFKSILINIIEKAEEIKLQNNNVILHNIIQRIHNVVENSIISFDDLRFIFRTLKKNNIRIVCILDEFDAGRYLFSGMPQLFHWLRELSSNPEFKAAIVLISKRRLQDVARLCGYNSDYWANVLMSINLRSFSDDEVGIFFKKLKQNHIEINEETQNEIIMICGGHPYLLDAFAYHAYEKVIRGNIVNSELVRSILNRITRHYFDQVNTILKDSTMLSKTIQILVGPSWDVTQNDVEELIDYGIIKRDLNSNIHAFSNSLLDYLQFIRESVDIWPLWRETERSLRDTLVVLLEDKYGKEWPESLMKAQIKIAPLIQDCQKKMAKEKEKFGSNASENLLAYTYPFELYQIMSTDWKSLGAPFLGNDKNVWSMKFSLLSKVRTPIAHNREEALKNNERVQAVGFCDEIGDRIKIFNNR